MTQFATAITKADALKFYEDMLLIRRFEERSAQLYGMGLIGGFCHLYIGQEAVVVGVQSVLTPEDAVITAYRDHGHMLACGMDPKGVMAELTGRAGGVSKGKGGSMHMFSREKNFYGGHGIVGAQVPLGAGLAFAMKYKQSNALSVTYMGDGAAHQGQVYEAFNMASLWKLPALFIIENNQYAMGTSVARSSSVPDLYVRGAGFGIPSKQVDGMDLFKVREAAAEAVAHIRAGKGPYLLEIKTYRYRGHSMSDPGNYRSKDEVEAMKTNHDPIQNFLAIIQKDYTVTESEIEAIETRVKDVMKEVVEFAKSSPEPEVSELYTDILIGE
jgi:pyruvate dehydrogenase E1 component alpha subunit